MDDGIILSSNRQLLVKLNIELHEIIKQVDLEFNKEKSNVFSIKQGITYLGFTYRLSNSGGLIIKMESKKKKRLVKHLNRHQLRSESLISYRNYLKKRSSNYQLIYRINKLIND